MSTTSLASSPACGDAQQARSAAASRSPASKHVRAHRRTLAARSSVHRDRSCKSEIPRRPSRNPESVHGATGSEVAGQPPPTSTLCHAAFECQQCRALCAVFVERGSTSRSRRGAPARRAPAARAARRRAPCVFQLSPVSNSNTRECVMISAAEPRPASKTLTRAVPGSGWRLARIAAASATQTADSRSDHGQRLSRTTPGSAANANHHGDGVARHSASSPSAAHASPGQASIVKRGGRAERHLTEARRHQHRQRAGQHQRHEHERDQRNRDEIDPQPRERQPVEHREREWRERQHDGELQAHGVRNACHHRRAASTSRAGRRRITPTATNDSQKPADSGAKGSSSSTAISASDQVRPAPTCRAESRASAKQREHQPGALRRAPRSRPATHRRPAAARPNNTAKGSRSTTRRGSSGSQRHSERAPRSQQREQRDVQPGNGHQVRRAGGVEHAPLIGAQPIGEPHGQARRAARRRPDRRPDRRCARQPGRACVSMETCASASRRLSARGQHAAREMHAVAKRKARGVGARRNCVSPRAARAARAGASVHLRAERQARRATRVAHVRTRASGPSRAMPARHRSAAPRPRAPAPKGFVPRTARVRRPSKPARAARASAECHPTQGTGRRATAQRDARQRVGAAA